MKILLVGDNRTSPNWGGRAVSIALHRLLSKRHTISGVVTGLRPWNSATSIRPHLPGLVVFSRGGVTARGSRSGISALSASWARAIPSFPIPREPRPYRSLSRRSRARRICTQSAGAATPLSSMLRAIWCSRLHPEESLCSFSAMAELGLEMGKSVYVVNSLVADCPLTGRNDQTVAAARDIFTRCQIVLTRDPDSLSYVRGKCRAWLRSMCPTRPFSGRKWRAPAARTCLPMEISSFPFPRRTITSDAWISVSPTSCSAEARGLDARGNVPVQSYRRLLRRLQDLGLTVYLIEADGPDSFLDEIAIEEGVGIVPVYTPIVASASILANARLLDFRSLPPFDPWLRLEALRASFSARLLTRRKACSESSATISRPSSASFRAMTRSSVSCTSEGATCSMVRIFVKRSAKSRDDAPWRRDSSSTGSAIGRKRRGKRCPQAP